MKTFYLITIAGACLNNYFLEEGTDGKTWKCSADKQYSHIIVDSAKSAWEISKSSPTVNVVEMQCGCETRPMSNLCMGPCPYSYKGCSLRPVQLSSATVVQTQYKAED